MPLDDDDIDPLDPDYNHFNNNVVNFTTHTIETFVKNSNLDPNSLNILHHNSRSLMSRGKQENYDVFFKSINNPFGILKFTETWLTNDTRDAYKIKGYTAIHLLRPHDQIFDFKERGGGISIFVRECIDFTHRQDLDLALQFIECCFIKTTFNNKKYLIAGM